jgi:hypothetical protein
MGIIKEKKNVADIHISLVFIYYKSLAKIAKIGAEI